MPTSSVFGRILRPVISGLVALALFSAFALLTADFVKALFRGRLPIVLSAVSLIGVGVSFLVLQLIVHPKRTELLKHFLLAVAFLLWGIVQLMPRNALSSTLGDVVIATYVADLA